MKTGILALGSQSAASWVEGNRTPGELDASVSWTEEVEKEVEVERVVVVVVAVVGVAA